MNTAIQAIQVLLPVAYLVTTILYGMSFAGEREPSIAKARPYAFGAVMGLHAALFLVLWRATGAFPIVSTWVLVSAIALTTAVLYRLVTLRGGQEPAGAIVLAAVTALQILASAFGPTAVAGDAAASGAFRILHVSTSVVATAALILSGIYGILHILLFRQMRNRQFGPLFKELPDLEQLARTTRAAAFFGFLFLTAGLNIGIWMGHKVRESFDYSDPHVLLTLAIWIHFGLIAFSRYIRGLTARRASYAAAAGLITLLITLLVTLLPSVTSHALG